MDLKFVQCLFFKIFVDEFLLNTLKSFTIQKNKDTIDLVLNTNNGIQESCTVRPKWTCEYLYFSKVCARESRSVIVHMYSRSKVSPILFGCVFPGMKIPGIATHCLLGAEN